MKPSRLLQVVLTVLVPSVVGCAADEQESPGAQFPPTAASEPTAAEPTGGPGEAPVPIEIAPPPPPPAPPPPAPQAQGIVPGETTEEEYDARPPDPAEANPDEYADTDPSALTDFRGALDPYGQWVDDPNYGTVWTPDPNVVGEDFAPYVSGGRWTYDDDQSWVWASDYDWGWAPFHYGRWAYLGSRWGWIPGRQYAGAWVSWRTGAYGGNNYLGWAPLQPAWGWRGGSAFGLGFAPRAPWVFCGANEVFSPGIGGHLVSGAQVAPVATHTRGFVAPSPPGSSGRVAAHPTVGPPPSSVGISPNEVVHTPTNNRGIMHAALYARPSTAQGLGAHAALASSQHYAAPRNALGVPYRNEPIARAPQYRGIAPGQHYFPSHSIGAYPAYGSAPHFGSGYSMGVGGGYSSPYAGRYGASVYGPGYGAYRGGGVVHSGNGGNSSSSEEGHEETPFHGGGSRGGFRGGGRGGGGGHGGGGHR